MCLLRVVSVVDVSSRGHWLLLFPSYLNRECLFSVISLGSCRRVRTKAVPAAKPASLSKVPESKSRRTELEIRTGRLGRSGFLPVAAGWLGISLVERVSETAGTRTWLPRK